MTESNFPITAVRSFKRFSIRSDQSVKIMHGVSKTLPNTSAQSIAPTSLMRRGTSPEGGKSPASAGQLNGSALNEEACPPPPRGQGDKHPAGQFIIRYCQPQWVGSRGVGLSWVVLSQEEGLSQPPGGDQGTPALFPRKQGPLALQRLALGERGHCQVSFSI